jgi:hypothetical protein
VTLDASQHLPRLTANGVVGTGDAARPQLTWASEMPLGGADGGIVMLDWYAETIQRTQEWILIVPPGATEVRLPELPESLAAWRPTADTNLPPPGVMFVESTSIAGYDDLRQQVGWMVFPYQGSSLTLFGDEDATLRVTGAHR